MKNLALIFILSVSSFFNPPVFSQDNQTSTPTGLAGDNLNLYRVLNLFQESETLEVFEQKLNAEDSKINNLDLDGDGRTDYIRVIDNVNGNAHSIVLQDVINEKEIQDVAVIEVDRDKNDQIQIQIIGDEQLYGKDYIIEPISGSPNPSYNGNATTSSYDTSKATIVNNNYYNTENLHRNPSGYVYAVGSWNIIRFIFSPSYIAYASPWRWSYYPSYWHPWYQLPYYDYYGRWHNHHSYAYFHKAYSYHVPNANTYYGPRRSSSEFVHQRIKRGEFNRLDSQSTIKSNRNDNQSQYKNRDSKNRASSADFKNKQNSFKHAGRRSGIGPRSGSASGHLGHRGHRR